MCMASREYRQCHHLSSHNPPTGLHEAASPPSHIYNLIRATPATYHPEVQPIQYQTTTKPTSRSTNTNARGSWPFIIPALSFAGGTGAL